VAGGKSNGAGAGRYDRVAHSKGRKVIATWEEAEAETLWRTIYEVTNNGDAIMFGRTRDEGAVVLTVLAGDERIRQYATGPEEIAELLQVVREAAQPD